MAKTTSGKGLCPNVTPASYPLDSYRQGHGEEAKIQSIWFPHLNPQVPFPISWLARLFPTPEAMVWLSRKQVFWGLLLAHHYSTKKTFLLYPREYFWIHKRGVSLLPFGQNAPKKWLWRVPEPISNAALRNSPNSTPFLLVCVRMYFARAQGRVFYRRGTQVHRKWVTATAINECFSVFNNRMVGRPLPSYEACRLQMTRSFFLVSKPLLFTERETLTWL